MLFAKKPTCWIFRYILQHRAITILCQKFDRLVSEVFSSQKLNFCQRIIMESSMNGIAVTTPDANSSLMPEAVQNASYADIVNKGKVLAPVSTENISNNNMATTDAVLQNSDNGDLNEDSAKNSSASDISTKIDPSDLVSIDPEKSQTEESQNIFEISPEVTEESNSTLSQMSVVNGNEEVEEDIENTSGLSSDEYSGSGEESDSEESGDIADMYPTSMKWQFRETNPKLPDTVTVLVSPNGGKVYLVGTAHFSLESQEDVAQTIRATQPDIVMVELCKSRVNILALDEATILEESKNMNFQKIRAAIEQNGFMQGVLYLLLLNMSAHLTKQLGMAPGGEFRRAFVEAKKVPGCLVHLGDRPIHITLQRALATLSWWQKLRIAWYMLTSKEPISKQEVERCKQRDLLEETLAEMTGEFPELSRVFVKERDIYLAYSLQMSASPMPSFSDTSPAGAAPTVVVGVVGIGHVPGIVEKWNTVTEKDIPLILNVPEPSTSSKVIRQVFRISIAGLVIYGCYRVLPKTLFRYPTRLADSWLSR